MAEVQSRNRGRWNNGSQDVLGPLVLKYHYSIEIGKSRGILRSRMQDRTHESETDAEQGLILGGKGDHPAVVASCCYCSRGTFYCRGSDSRGADRREELTQIGFRWKLRRKGVLGI